MSVNRNAAHSDTAEQDMHAPAIALVLYKGPLDISAAYGPPCTPSQPPPTPPRPHPSLAPPHSNCKLALVSRPVTHRVTRFQGSIAAPPCAH